MKKFYEIVRLEEQGPDNDLFTKVKKLIDRGWVRKALEFLLNWDYGEENIGTAEYLGRIWNGPTDDRETSDRVIRRDGDTYLCECVGWKNGGYSAFYLTREFETEN